MITIDTSGYLAIVNTADRHHASCRDAMKLDPGPYVLPAAILAEIAWGIDARIPGSNGKVTVRNGLLTDLEEGRLLMDCGEKDFGRILQLVERYDDLHLGIADAAVIACAERHGGRVLTTDRRHFPVVSRGERTIHVFPES